MGGETKAHAELKRASLFWAQAQGYRIAAPEVRVPQSSYRADVAAYRIPAGEGDEKAEGDVAIGRTVIFECKQSRADFLSDAHPERASLDRLEELEGRRRKLEQQLGVHYPSLRKGESLFPEYDGFAHEEIGHQGLGKLVKEIDMLKNRVFEKTKFDRLVRYGCANSYYLVTGPGIVEAHELPAGWGWLEAESFEANGDEAAPPRLLLRAKPQLHRIAGSAALALLHRLAAAGTKQSNRAQGIDPGDLFEARRRGE